MCLLIADLDLGPADALLDREEGILALDRSLDELDRRIAARMILERSGIWQVPLRITCVCGLTLDVDEPTVRAVS